MKHVCTIKYDLETTSYKNNTSQQHKTVKITSHLGTEKRHDSIFMFLQCVRKVAVHL
jgi:hypothetical protein